MELKTWERKLNKWLGQDELDDALSRELRVLAARRDRKASRDLEERFYCDLKFGTSGLRGLMGAGTNRLNVHTVRKIAQGICDYLAEDLDAFDGLDTFTRTLVLPEVLEKAPAIAIGYDSRNNSRAFAEAAAEVFVANGVRVFMMNEITPVAAVSYVIRKLGCLAGVMMTASHNPKEYNGVKVYNSDGIQVLPHEQKAIYARISVLDEFADISYLDFEKAEKTPFFEYVKDEVIEEYIDCIISEKVYKKLECDSEWTISAQEEAEQEAFSKLSVLYTPLNGGGRRVCLEMMKRIGIGKFEVVKSQEKPDGNFPTCHYPNPETEEAFAEALEIAKMKRPDLIIATDPDCDRLGVVIKLGNGFYRKLNGNEVGIIMLDHIIQARRSFGTCGKAEELKGRKMPEMPVAARSFTASALADVIARENGVECKVIPNGSNYIGEMINELEREGRKDDFIFAFEESIEYISGTYARDEDGVLGALHILSAAAEAKAEGKTLSDVLDEIYEKYGYFENDSMNIAFHGIEGIEKMEALMTKLRDEIKAGKWNKLGDSGVLSIRDYKSLLEYKTEGAGEPETINFPKLNAVEFILENDSGAIIRPSGTEPKLKIYMHAKGSSVEDAKEACGNIERALLEIIKA